MLCSFYNEDGDPLPYAYEQIVRRAAEVLTQETGMVLEAFGELEYYLVGEVERIFPVQEERGHQRAHRHRARPASRGAMILPVVLSLHATPTFSERIDMAIIRAHEFISLDGVFESPSWTMEFGFDPKMGETLATITADSNAILLGRTTHEMFAPAWRDRTEADDPGAPFFNDTEKFVVGSREPAEAWANTTRLGAYDAVALRAFKESREGSIYISGSGRLVRGLIADHLLDELNLFMFPVALGVGDRLFADELVKFELAGSEVYDNGVLHLRLVPRS